MQVYKEFQGLCESKLTVFLISKSVDAATFAKPCKEALESPGNAADKGFLEILMSMSEYTYFVRMMAESADGIA